MESESSQKIRQRVIAAREIQSKRFKGRKEMFCNADMQSKDIGTHCILDTVGEELWKMAITKPGYA
ncbi:MAG TPA: hypothetical protein VL633_10865 [Bacteroidota bacterium]|nr:hypothetical protein [Bacteroidota bacterium]